MRDKPLPTGFMSAIEALEPSYLACDDPIQQSGFGGGAERWRAERSPILDAIEAGGDLLDIGCANGHLLECLMQWGAERGVSITPWGLDLGERLIEAARVRLPGFEAHFFVGNAWLWTPPRRFRSVYMLYDCVPVAHLAEQLHHLASEVVEPGGRLIVGAYGSRSRGLPPFDIGGFMREAGFEVCGERVAGEPPTSAFAWVDVV